MTENVIELPKYQCHKQVWALKIKDIQKHEFLQTPGTPAPANYYTIVPENKRYMNIEVDEKYWLKHQPQTGGYYVLYKDGYRSYSPAKEFEDGYTLL